MYNSSSKKHFFIWNVPFWDFTNILKSLALIWNKRSHQKKGHVGYWVVMQLNFQSNEHSFAVWDDRTGNFPCVCYNDGQRKCLAYAMKLAIPAGGSIHSCLSDSVVGKLNMLHKSCPFRPTKNFFQYFFLFSIIMT